MLAPTTGPRSISTISCSSVALRPSGAPDPTAGDSSAGDAGEDASGDADDAGDASGDAGDDGADDSRNPMARGAIEQHIEDAPVLAALAD